MQYTKSTLNQHHKRVLLSFATDLFLFNTSQLTSANGKCEFDRAEDLAKHFEKSREERKRNT